MPMMRAVGVTEYGGPEVLRLVDVPRPSAGPGQVRIRVHAATVNPGDTLLRIGDLDEVLRSGPLTPPYIPGMEAAGVVDELGSGAQTDLRVGDRVMTIVMPIDATGGAYAEYLAVDADQVAHAPAGTSHVEAATLPMNGLTARRALDVLDLRPGETVAVTGAAGAVGGYAIQLAKVDQLRVIADASPADENLIATLGADQIVGRGPGVGQRIRQWWPEGVAAVVDAALQGADVVPAIRDDGQIAAVRMWELPGSAELGDERGITVRDVWAVLPTIVAADMRRRRGLEPIAPHHGLGYVENFLTMCFGTVPEPVIVEAFEQSMTLYAEHSFNASTFAARVVTSTQSDIYSAVTAAIGALKGSLHGGANEAVMHDMIDIGTGDNASEWLHGKLSRKEKVMGFGHRVYRNGDSRVPTMKAALERVVAARGGQQYLDIYRALESGMLATTGIKPNLDFPTGPAYHLMGFDISSFTPIFVMSRITGWTAHIIEQAASNALIRPLSEYSGQPQRALA